jgi:hypothetical protein
MNREIEELSFRVLRSTRVVAFDFIYNGIEVEGRYTEWDDGYGGSPRREVEIEANEDLSDDDMDYLNTWVEESL